ncbi:MAG: outer membrane beta-barrel protein [Candidatus Omnitrophica bacterium]|nr:outer membrane beta-barrel protein [Candidatus Omnitrophota bacterium]
MKRHPRRQRLLALAASAGTIACHVQAFQATDLLAYSVGPVTLRPHAGLAESYDDNIFFQTAKKVGDSITTTSAGMSASLGRETPVNPWIDFFEEESNFVSIDYNLDYLIYATQSDLNAPNHDFSFKGRWRGNRLTVKGGDSVQLISGILSGGYTVAQKLNINRAIYNDNYMVDYAVSQKTRVYLNGTHYATDYESGTPLYDDNTLRATAGFGYQAFSKTSLFGEAYYGQSAIDPNLSPQIQPKGPHSTFEGGFLGVQGHFTAHLSGMLKVGYESREFSDNSPAPSSPVVEMSIVHRFREKTMTTLTYRRLSSISVQSAGVSYTADNFGLRLDQRLGSTGRWAASAGANVELGDYGESRFYTNRQDQWYRFNVGLAYLIRPWIRTDFNYQFQKFTSNGPGIIDYDDNRVTLSLAVGY